ncbi:transposase [Sphingobacterium pedocola]|uniref:Transposase n=1 Tax=Sphingobacterium pedocola TaxID=2082722 RepID=A0ABR9TBS9_9SPHI|nr:transposase [Sphingobacterium pedocola]MBE8722502.1 transposase [Sphingobacterium pedocola]
MDINQQYLERSEWALVITILAYFLLNGAQIFETAVIVPKWTSNPPFSLGLLKGINLKTFWIITHSIHEITFIAAIALCWKIDAVRNWLLLLLIFHIIIRVWTLIYFAPNIISFQSGATEIRSGHELVEKVRLWKQLNLVRVALYITISLGFLPLLFKVIKLKAL